MAHDAGDHQVDYRHNGGEPGEEAGPHADRGCKLQFACQQHKRQRTRVIQRLEGLDIVSRAAGSANSFSKK
ncbi:hypothetical protein E1178_13580 [Roseibium hamelinense]|uniref:hypothetical protein n=1 Tax=Roseibium hamelinense TaxID=150831 RepID=UPI0011A60805|nr:hypothetical protein [Roseibium hamelinense]MTI44640.1 hypothetical protein [Roseibium hamelinense]